MLVLCGFCLLQYLRHISFQRHSFSSSLWICIKCLICFLLSLLKWCGPGVSPCFHQGFSCSSWFLHSFCRWEASIACSLCWPQVSPCTRHVQQVTILQSAEAKDCSRHDCWGRSQCRSERRTVSLFWNVHKISSDNVCALPRLEGMWLSQGRSVVSKSLHFVCGATWRVLGTQKHYQKLRGNEKMWLDAG